MTSRRNTLSHSAPVRIVETGQVFPSQQECAKSIGGRAGAISNCLRGERETHLGFHFEHVKMTSYLTTDDPKTLRETLNVAQALIARDILLAPGKRKAYLASIQRLIDECDRHRPYERDRDESI